jgi:hypothetical protein
LLDTHFTVENMRTNVDRLAAFIRPAAVADPHGPGATAFENAVGFIKSDVARLRARLDHLLSGAPTVPLAIQPVGVNDFEGFDDYGLMAGGMMMCNANTTLSVAMNVTTPLAGAQTCRVSFNFGNESKTWQQWAWYKMPFVAQPTNLNQYTGVRFKVRSNTARVLRFDIDSPNYKAVSQGIQLGWDVPVDNVGKTVEVRFAEARIPGWATDAGDNLTNIMATASALQFQPICAGRDGSGQLPPGVIDDGWLDLDDIEIF